MILYTNIYFFAYGMISNWTLNQDKSGEGLKYWVERPEVLGLHDLGDINCLYW